MWHSLSKSKRLLVLAVAILVLLWLSVPPALLVKNKKPSAEVQRTKHHSKIAKVSVAIHALGSPIIKRSLKTHFKHNALNGYRHFIAKQKLVDEIFRSHGPRGAWSKPAYLLSIIINELSKPPEKRLEWLFWFDADTIIANPYTPLEIFLPPSTEELRPIHFLVASNRDGMNTGVFAIRVHRWSVSFLSAVVAYPVYFAANVTTNKYQDQSAFSWLLESSSSPAILNARDHWINVPMRWFNSLPFNNHLDVNGDWVYNKEMTPELFDRGTDEGYEENQYMAGVRPWKVMQGDLAVHFAGSGASGVRDSWMVPWLERVEAMTPDWADNGVKDRLKLEVAEFWERKASELREAPVQSSRGG